MSTGDGQQNSGQTKKSSPTVGVIVGGVVGGLVFLAAVGVGVWAFLGRRKASGGVHPTNTEHSSEVALHENGMQPPEMRLYVRFFVLLSDLFLTDVGRIRLTHSPSREISTIEVGYTHPHSKGPITPVPRNCERLGETFASTWNTRFFTRGTLFVFP